MKNQIYCPCCYSKLEVTHTRDNQLMYQCTKLSCISQEIGVMWLVDGTLYSNDTDKVSEINSIEVISKFSGGNILAINSVQHKLSVLIQEKSHTIIQLFSFMLKIRNRKLVIYRITGEDELLFVPFYKQAKERYDAIKNFYDKTDLEKIGRNTTLNTAIRLLYPASGSLSFGEKLGIKLFIILNPKISRLLKIRNAMLLNRSQDQEDFIS